jgi:hypothetical protein
LGEIIRKSAAAADIFADLELTLTRAAARGGPWLAAAAAFLRPTVKLGDALAVRLAAAAAALVPLRAERDARDADADDVLGRTADEAWNEVGRPAPGTDPVLAVLFPGGVGAWTDGPVAEQPDAMEILAELLQAHLHPAIPDDRADAWAAEVLAAAAPLSAAVVALAEPATRAAQLSKIYGSLARSAQVQLSRLKRTWKGHGWSEADIHTVIPDRPRPVPAPAEV